MARATDAMVIDVVEVDSDISLTPFITAANELVTEVCTDSSYSSTRLQLIETWLAAHFYAMRDQQVMMERAGPVQTQYQHKGGLCLYQTKQGQTAMILDTAGNLAQLSKRIEGGEAAGVVFGWMGTDYDTEDDED